jgi:hypothetical protein
MEKNHRIAIGVGAGAIVVFFLLLPPSSSSYKQHMPTAVVVPTFTIAAYQPHGFYDYYRGNCSTRCLTVPLHPKERTGMMNYSGSYNALAMIKSLGISDKVTDEQVTENPSLLTNYGKVIVLHNEYVTQAEFDSIVHHHDVLYLYPNALYALVSYNASARTITLERGHGYRGINDAFGWAPSASTKSEYNTDCKDWHFEKAVNGSVLDCYPEHDILHDPRLWAAITN